MKLPQIHHIKRKEWIIYSVALGFFAFFLLRVTQQAEVQRRYGFRVGSPEIGGINGCEDTQCHAYHCDKINACDIVKIGVVAP